MDALGDLHIKKNWELGFLSGVLAPRMDQSRIFSTGKGGFSKTSRGSRRFDHIQPSAEFFNG
jgi:hypothetical protein